MSNTRTTSGSSKPHELGLDLLVELKGSRVRAGLTEALREAIRSGRLPAGSRMPASRMLATDLGLARSTITECYGELIAEGWLTARQGSGTHVANVAQQAIATPSDPSRAGGEIEGLAPGAADFADFPRQQWLAAARRVLASAPYSAFGYGDPGGNLHLRTALAGYLARVRGVSAGPEQIIICSGFHHGLGLMARALRARGAESVATESYGLGLYRDVLTETGLRIPPLAVDERGARTDELDGTVDAALLTPAHQFPTGAALSPDRRAHALRWAQRTGGLILEDDYDGEFRYDRAPVAALQGIDPDHVAYFGTASKSVAPALRVAWMVVPRRLVPAVLAAKGAVETVSVIDQLTLAEFIASGAFDRNVRLRRQNYRRRREQLTATLSDSSPAYRLIGMQAGLQAVIALPAGLESATLQAAASRGLIMSGLSEFRHPDADRAGEIDGLVVNFSAISDSAWPSTLSLLGSAIRANKLATR
jgi:GntR family transcriptional regulator/MocR family aminotransferase